ncbi:MAG: response regulator [Firmicutes bacterium]|nr:response regulator [Bacillota bacterium]
METGPDNIGHMPRDRSCAPPGATACLQQPTRVLSQQILQAQKMETIGQLAGGLAHDLNNQLLVIRGCIELCRLENPEDSVSGHLLKQARMAADRAAGLTRQILLFTRQQPQDKRIVDLNGNVRELQAMLSRLMGEDISLVLDLSDSLWPVNADATNMDQVITNLLLNARDAMPQGGVITVKTENVTLDEVPCRSSPCARAGRYVRLTVSDTGIGIPEDVMPHIFEPFFTTKPTGTGLGLSVTYGIVTAHDGWIVARSTPGRGSTFEVYLPAVTFPANYVFHGGGENASPNTPQGHGEHIILVEDEPNVRALTEKVLQSGGYVVHSCGRISEAVEVSRSRNREIDLVISDVVLPDGNGHEFALRFASDYPSAAILLVSGYPDSRAKYEEIACSGLPYLQKPYTFGDLLRKVDEVLKRRQGAGPGAELPTAARPAGLKGCAGEGDKQVG